MRVKRFSVKLTIILFLLLFAMFWTMQPMPTQAAGFSYSKDLLGKHSSGFGNAYFFGDSLTDCCWTQRYTNSGTPNWADLLPARIGASFTASKQANLAVAGAAVATSANPTVAAALGVPTGFLAQVDRFESEGISVSSNDIVGIWIGTNDIWPSSYAATDQAPVGVGPFNRSLGTQPSVVDLTNYVTSNMRTGVNRLVADGFRNIVLISPYDLGQSAIEPNTAAASLATQYSVAIRNAEKSFYTPGVNTYFVDALSLLQRVQANPNAYGFKHINAVDNCQANNCSNLTLKQQNSYIFNDILHLTNGFDQVLVKEAAAIINAGVTIQPCP